MHTNVAIISHHYHGILPSAITVNVELPQNSLAEITARGGTAFRISASFFVSEETSLPPLEPSRRR